MAKSFINLIIDTEEEIQYIGAGDYYWDKDKSSWKFNLNNRHKKNVKYFSNKAIKTHYLRQEE